MSGENFRPLESWLYSHDLTEFTQFTIDWVEQTIDRFEYKIETDILYQVKNILEIMKPELPDYEFFNEIRNRYDSGGQAKRG